jgi:hypothetical protein
MVRNAICSQDENGFYGYWVNWNLKAGDLLPSSSRAE